MAGKGGKRRTSWPKGKSGNVRGRPKKDFEAQALVAAATNDGADIVKVVDEIMRLTPDCDAKGNPIADPTAQVRLAAAKALADRLWGTAPTRDSLTVTGPGGGPVQHKWVEVPVAPPKEITE